MGIGAIAQATSEDQTLQKIAALIKKGQTWIPKTETAEVQRFRPILPQLTVTGNGIILKDERIILPTKLQEKAIQIAHKGAHPGQEGLKRRLRYHFFFHGMDKKVEEFVKSCSDCNVFVDKKTKEPIKPHRVPEKCWETVAVDLFGPMSSSKHVVVVQDLASRYPAAKLVTSTKADKVIPALTEIYETYGNPDVQISDNGPPFNPATNLPPAAMIFRHGQRLDFPRRHATDEEMSRAREAEQKKKMENESKVNGSKYRKKSHFIIGDNVLIRNYNKSRKFDTLFLQEAFKIIDMNREGNIVTVQQEGSGLTLCRHPDDLKPSKSRPDNREEKQECMQYADIQWPEVIEHDDDDESYCLEKRDTAPPPRRSQRKRTTIPVYK